MMMLVKREQNAKAEFPILVTPLGTTQQLAFPGGPVNEGCWGFVEQDSCQSSINWVTRIDIERYNVAA